MATTGKLALVFQGLSTVAIVTLAGLAVRRELKSGGQGSLLGAAPSSHRRHGDQMAREAKQIARRFRSDLDRRRCSEALDALLELERTQAKADLEEEYGRARHRVYPEHREAFERVCRVQSR